MKIISRAAMAIGACILTFIWLPWHSDSRAAVPSGSPSVNAAGNSPSEVKLSGYLSEIKATRPWRIAFIPKFKYFGENGKLSSYWQAAWYGAQKAGKDFGVNLKLVTANTRGKTDADYVEPQIRLIANLISQSNVDGLVIAPFDSDRLAPVVDKAIGAGIPTVAMDTPISSDRVLTFVCFNNFAAGRSMGEWVVKALGRPGKALILDGPQDEQNAVDRRNGLLAGLHTGNIDILNAKTGDWETEPARKITAGWLEKYRDMDVILAANDYMAMGAAQALAAAKRSGVLVTGFDATDDALRAIKAGRIAATVDQSPGGQARTAIQLLIHRLENRERFSSVVSLPMLPLVTRENVDAYLSQRRLK